MALDDFIRESIGSLDKSEACARQTDETYFSPHYTMEINSSRHGIVKARVPEQIQMQITSEWDSILGSSGLTSIGVLVSELSKFSTRNEFTSALAWAGNTPIELTIPLEFYAESHAEEEVIEPIRKLGRMALPGSKSLFNGNIILFSPPGPRLFDLGDATSDDIIIQIGNFLYFTQVVIVGINPTFSTKDLSPEGFPLRASCDVTFRTVLTLTYDKYSRLFPKRK